MSIQEACNLCANQLIARQIAGEQITDSLVIDTITQFAPIINGVDLEKLKDLLLTNFNVTIDMSITLVDSNHYTPWLDDFKVEHRNWPFWDRYKKYLQVNKHLNKDVVNELDDMTDNTLDKLFNPLAQQDAIFKKGLVVGQVQSGKTMNYTGLVCKAADAGFNFIIVLAGALKDLRSQTQSRLDDGFLGRITDKTKLQGKKDDRNGVGYYGKLSAHSYTISSLNGDFNKIKANGITGFDFGTKEPVILVIKKNKSILNKFIFINIYIF